jgi:hypothetical protein
VISILEQLLPSRSRIVPERRDTEFEGNVLKIKDFQEKKNPTVKAVEQISCPFSLQVVKGSNSPSGLMRRGVRFERRSFAHDDEAQMPGILPPLNTTVMWATGQEGASPSQSGSI